MGFCVSVWHQQQQKCHSSTQLLFSEVYLLRLFRQVCITREFCPQLRAVCPTMHFTTASDSKGEGLYFNGWQRSASLCLHTEHWERALRNIMMVRSGEEAVKMSCSHPNCQLDISSKDLLDLKTTFRKHTSRVQLTENTLDWRLKISPSPCSEALCLSALRIQRKDAAWRKGY